MGTSGGLLIERLLAVGPETGGDQRAHEPLLFGNACHGVDHVEAELLHDSIVLTEHFALKEPEALHGVGAPAEVHAGLVELELHTACHQTVERHIDGHSKVERKVWLHGKAV